MPTAVKSFETRVKEARLKSEMTAMVQKLYAESVRYIEPMPPFILVRTLPRSTITSSGIILPEKQNKPNIEAVVLAVYEPYWEKVEKVSEKGESFDISVHNVCDVHVGDHIIIPHHVGLPDTFLDEREYRLIREDDAMARVEYLEKGWLKKELKSLPFAGTSADELADIIMEKFDLVPKQIFSRTTSGK